MTKKIPISEDELRQFFLMENHSVEECAEHFKCSVGPIHKAVREYGLYKKDHREILGTRLNPRKKIIAEEDIRQKYLVEGLNLDECAELFGCSTVTFEHRCRELGIYKPLFSKYEYRIKQALEKGLSKQETADEVGCSIDTVRYTLQKRGWNKLVVKRVPVHYVSSCSKIRVRGLKKKGERYSGEYAYKNSPEYQNATPYEKAKITSLRRYGTTNPAASEEIKTKIKQTFLRKYGVPHSVQSEEGKRRASEKLKKTLALKNGDAEKVIALKKAYLKKGRPLKASERRKILGLSQSNADIFMKRYGLEDLWDKKKNPGEDEVETFLKTVGVAYEKHNRQVIKPQELDFYIPEYKVGLEFNDVGSHNSTKGFAGSSPKDKKYHYNKSAKCESKGVRLIHIWEHQWRDERCRKILESIIRGACNQATTIYARKCQIEIRPTKEVKQFFIDNHLQGFRGGRFAICLTYEGEIIMAYIFGKAFMSRSKYEWEVIRAATKCDYRVIGGASKIWKFFQREYHPQSVVYYVDYNLFNGNSMNKLGFEYDGHSVGYWVYNRETEQVQGRNPAKNKELQALRKQGVLWDIWHAGTKRYIWLSES